MLRSPQHQGATEHCGAQRCFDFPRASKHIQQVEKQKGSYLKLQLSCLSRVSFQFNLWKLKPTEHFSLKVSPLITTWLWNWTGLSQKSALKARRKTLLLTRAIHPHTTETLRKKDKLCFLLTSLQVPPIWVGASKIIWQKKCSMIFSFHFTNGKCGPSTPFEKARNTKSLGFHVHYHILNFHHLHWTYSITTGLRKSHRRASTRRLAEGISHTGWCLVTLNGLQDMEVQPRFPS